MQPAAGRNDEEQIRELVSRWISATKRGDLDALLALIADDVTPPQGGQRITRAGHTLTVLRRERGKWLLARDANMLAAAPSPSDFVSLLRETT